MENLFLRPKLSWDSKKFTDKSSSKELQDIRSDIFKNYICTRDDMILVGNFAYNIYIKKSGLSMNDKRQVHLNELELYVDDYTTHIKNITKYLIEKYPDIDIDFQEHYPFFQFYDRKIVISVNGNAVVSLYRNLESCIPFQIFKSKNLRLGILYFLLMFLYIQQYRFKIEGEKNSMLKYGYMIDQLKKARLYFLKENNLAPTDKSLFQELQIECLGGCKIHPYTNTQLERYTKYKQNKTPNFRYEPSRNRKDPKVKEKYHFPNISGNKIINIDHMTIKNKKYYLEHLENPVKESVTSSSSDTESILSDTESISDSDSETEKKRKKKFKKKEKKSKKIEDILILIMKLKQILNLQIAKVI